MQEVTSKNTKNEILDAYEGLLQEIKENKTNKAEVQKVNSRNTIFKERIY